MNEVLEVEQRDDEEQAQAGRAGTYRLLASLLCDFPPADVIQQVATLPQTTEQDDMSVSLAALSAAAQSFPAEQVTDEYQALFIGVGRGELVPYGCFYITGFLMEKPLGVLRDELANLGYARQEGVTEPEDHIAFLCEVMSLMISDGLTFEQQQTFFQAHIAPWADRFFTDLIAAEAADFYSRVGKLGQAFMAFEASYFSMTA